MKTTNPTPQRPAALFRWLAVWFAACATSSAEVVTLIDCQDPGAAGDSLTRGFYVTRYPGATINGVTVYLKILSGSFPYQVGLNVTQGTFDGPIVASGYADATLNTTEKAVTIQMTHGGGTNPAVAPGSTLCFSFFLNQQPGSPDPFFSVIGALGVDLPDATDPCPNLVETEGTAPPLSTFRREGVRLRITGNKFLNVNPGQSIQLAINHAATGDVVRVAPGTYTENLTLRSDVDVIGAGAGDVTLRGSGSGDVVTATSVTNMEFAGFTVENSGTNSGDAGFQIDGGSPFIRDNIIQGNTDGIRLTGSSTAFICGNTVRDNGNGGNGFIDWGIIILGGATPLVSNNIVHGNEVGIYLFSSGVGTQIVNNTIVANDGDGIWCNDSSPTIKNNIVTGNLPGISGLGTSANPSLTYNNVWNNRGFGNYNAQSGATIVAGTGSISVDPMLDSTFQLMLGSPCIDVGDPSAIYNDLDGSRNDIGATGGPCGSAAPPGSVVDGFLWTSVGLIPVADIDQTTGSKGGMTFDRDRPFGGQPWLFGPFGSNETSVYRYAIKVGKWSGSTPPAAGAFTYVDDPLSKVRYNVSGGTITTSNVSLGPVTFAGVPSYTPTVNGSGTYWAHENLRVILNTLELDEGRYSVRLEGYTFLGSLVTLSPNRDLVLTINNTLPVVVLDQISFAGGLPIDECAIIPLPSPTSTLDFVFTANHPDGFLDDYALGVAVGKNRSGGVIVSDSYANHVTPTAVWNGVITAPVAATPANPAAPLPALQHWERCAYQFSITAWARTTNGFGRIYWTTYSDNHAIDLGSGGSPADLDGDGDVDAQDLAIFAAAYGTVAP